MTGKPILIEDFDGTTRDTLTLVVEIAWGADITAADTTWTWTDVTADAYLDPGVSITLGRADEASTPQPAECTFTLDNTAGDYSSTPLGANWPNVKRGTPIRVRSILGTTSHNRFEGFAVGFTPAWDETGNHATTQVTAAGVLRRLGQGSSPLQSVMRTDIPTLSDLTAYWPLEDDQTATSIASGLPNGLPMQITGTPEFASNTDFASSSPIVVLKNAYLLGSVTPRVTSSAVKVTALISFPEAGSASPNASTVLRLHTVGSIIRWDLIYDTGGALELRGFDHTGQQFTTGPVGFDVDSTVARVGVQLVQNGADVDTQVSVLAVGLGNSASYSNQTASGETMTGCYAVALAPAQDQTNVAVGHVYVQSIAADIFDLLSQLNAFTDEGAGDRFKRLCQQVGTPATVAPDLTGVAMGPQTVDTFPNLVQECADAELGVVVDGLSAGLTFFLRDQQTNEAAALTIDASDGVIIPPFAPVDDDQLLRNRWTVTQKDGSSAVSQDTDGPLGVNTVGLYDDSLTVNVANSATPKRVADWKVHQSTVPGYRYPSLTLAFEATPDLLDDWLSASLMSRVDITNITDVASQLPDQDIRLLVQGYAETITEFSWRVAMNTSSYDPWRVVELAGDTGDNGEFLCHLDTNGSTVHTAASAAATSLSVSTTSGPLWTTASDDFPLTVEIAGIPVTVTNITGSSSPQTFTVEGTTVTKSLPAGTAVSVWEETVLEL